jgi:hypothetical protein
MGDVRERGGLLRRMEVIIRGKLRIMKLMGMANIMILMGISMKGNGKIICLMVQAKLYTRMEAATSVNFSITKEMVMAYTS